MDEITVRLIVAHTRMAAQGYRDTEVSPGNYFPNPARAALEKYATELEELLMGLVR